MGGPCCIVPKCSNRSPGHRLPADLKLRKAWMIAIKRDKFVPSVHSRVCKKHFKAEDYVPPKDSVREKPLLFLRKGAVPSVFAWTKATTTSSLRRLERARNREGKPGRNVLSNKEVGNSSNESDVDEPDIPNISEVPIEQGGDVVMDDFNIANEECVVVSEVDALDTSPNGDNVCPLDMADNANMENEQQQEAVCEYVTPLVTSPNAHAMRIDHYRSQDMWEELQFYTGFESYSHFMCAFNLLGPAVQKLHYYSTYSLDSGYVNKCLIPEDQFFLVLMKLRRFTLNKELSYRFRISKNNVSVLVITWINFLFCQLKEIDIWASHDDLSKLTKLKGTECDATVIIDCTEIKIVQPRNVTSQQQCYSTYKGCHTVKVLIGMTPTGAISFVSEACGGSTSDRQVVEKSGFLDILKAGDRVLADRGFNIQDLLATRNVKIIIPDFVPAGKGQLKPAQRKRSMKIASKRIHIERIIALAKTYAILKGPLSSNLVPLASRIVFVCFMLANFRPNIVM